ncbi:Dephospho-coa kinase, partial [Globisporangium splendens]
MKDQEFWLVGFFEKGSDAGGGAVGVATAWRGARRPVGPDQGAAQEELVEALGTRSRAVSAGATGLLSGFFVGRVVGASLVGVGLTGGIATGKSTVSKTFQEAGAVIVDADIVARQVVMPGQGAYKEIVKVFGEDVLNEDDKMINRAKLGAIIFGNPAKRKRLDACTHASTLRIMMRGCSEIFTLQTCLMYHRLIQRKRLVVLDAPLLFETLLLEHFCYPTIVVACSEAHELDRLVKRDSLSEEDATKRIQSQMKLHEKVRKADLVIQNDGTLDELLLNARQTLQRTAELVGATKEMSKRKKGVSLEEKRERLLHIYHDAKDVFNLKEIEKLGAKAGVDVNQALVDDALVDCDKIGSGNYFWSFPSKVSQSRKRKLSELEQRKTATQEKLSKVKLAIEAQKNMRTESVRYSVFFGRMPAAFARSALSVINSGVCCVEQDDRAQKLQRLAELQEKVKVLKTNIHHLAENDPEILEEMDRRSYAYRRLLLASLERKVQIAKLGADRWTDNVFTMRSWVVQKRGCASSEVCVVQYAALNLWYVPANTNGARRMMMQVDKWLGIKDDFDYIE